MIIDVDGMDKVQYLEPTNISMSVGEEFKEHLVKNVLIVLKIVLVLLNDPVFRKQTREIYQGRKFAWRRQV